MSGGVNFHSWGLMVKAHFWTPKSGMIERVICRNSSPLENSSGIVCRNSQGNFRCLERNSDDDLNWNRDQLSGELLLADNILLLNIQETLLFLYFGCQRAVCDWSRSPLINSWINKYLFFNVFRWIRTRILYIGNGFCVFFFFFFFEVRKRSILTVWEWWKLFRDVIMRNEIVPFQLFMNIIA